MKRILIFLSVVLALVILVGCSSEIDITSFDKDVKVLYNKIDNSESVTSDITLTKTYLDQFTVEWISDNEAIIIKEDKGIVKRSNEKNEEVLLTASVVINEKSLSKFFTLIVLKIEDEKNEEPIKETFTVSYNLNYQTDEVIESVIVEDGTILTKELVTPTRVGYEFLGWYLYEMKYTNINITEDVTLTAMWGEDLSIVKTYTENFSNVVEYRRFIGYPQSDYSVGRHISNGIEWDYGYFRTDVGMSENAPKAITLKGSGDGTGAGRGWATALDVDNGISYLEFEARLPFSPNSTYPQVNGKDEARNVYITVNIEQNGELVYTSKDLNRDRQFLDNKEANKGKKFVFDDINIKGVFNLTIEVSSGHRATIANVLWMDNKGIAEGNTELIQSIDFNDLEIDQYNSEDTILELNGNNYIVKELWANNKNIHGQKELPFLTEENGTGIARLRGNATKYPSTPLAYIYNEQYISSLSSLSFTARKFGDGGYPGIGKVNVYYQTSDSTEWILIAFDNALSLDFKVFDIPINKENVRIKLEASEGTINIDNVEFYK